MEYVSALASGMQYYAPEDILRGPYMMDDYQAAVLAELLQQMRPDNALVTFSDQAVTGDRVSKYYEVPYSQQPLDLKRVASAADDPGAPALHLPAPNEFIAEDVSLVALPESPCRRCRRSRWKPTGRKSGLCRTTSSGFPGASPTSIFARRRWDKPPSKRRWCRCIPRC